MLRDADRHAQGPGERSVHRSAIVGRVGLARAAPGAAVVHVSFTDQTRIPVKAGGHRSACAGTPNSAVT